MHKQNRNFEKMQLVCTLNNRSRIVKGTKGFEIQGEPTEGALKVFAEKLAKFDSDAVPSGNQPNNAGDFLEKKFGKVGTLDFSS